MVPVICCPNAMMLPVRMKTSAERIRALAHSREYLAKLRVFTFDASRVFLLSERVATCRPHTRSRTPLKSINCDSERRASGFRIVDSKDSNLVPDVSCKLEVKNARADVNTFCSPECIEKYGGCDGLKADLLKC